MIKNCNQCDNEYETPPCQASRRKYCSYTCYYVSQVGVNNSPGTQFKIGHSYNYGIAKTPEHRKKISEALKGRKLPQEVIERMRLNAKRGSNVPTWKGDNASYVAIHIWLKTNYGKADHCDFDTNHESKWFEWALLKGKQYSHNRDNFIQLCISCHRKYDAKKELEYAG